MDKLNRKTKRAPVNSDKSHAVDGEKLKYQTLLMEYLDLQKEFVSRKKKLQAAKQKKETVSAEVRFLRQRHKYLSKGQAPNSDNNNAVAGRTNQSTSEAAPRNLDQVLINEDGVGKEKAKKVKIPNKRRYSLINDKVVTKRKISWPDQLTLKV